MNLHYFIQIAGELALRCRRGSLNKKARVLFEERDQFVGDVVYMKEAVVLRSEDEPLQSGPLGFHGLLLFII